MLRVVDRRRIRARWAPRIHRDANGFEVGAEHGTRDLLLANRLRGPQRVPRRESLAPPAIGEEPAVEPGMGRFMEDDEGRRVVGDLDLPGLRVVAPGEPAGTSADRLRHDQRLADRPWQSDVL